MLARATMGVKQWQPPDYHTTQKMPWHLIDKADKWLLLKAQPTSVRPGIKKVLFSLKTFHGCGMEVFSLFK